MIFGLIPAAGKSLRMGRPKLSLPLGESTVLEQVLAALRAGQVEHILVVLGPHGAELAPLAERAQAHVCRLREETADMRATIEQGLRWLEDRFQPRPDDAFLLAPADHPTLDPHVVDDLRAARLACPGRTIFVPTHEGRRGHPTLVAWKHVPGIRVHPAGQGLNTYLRRQAAQIQEVAVASAEVLRDLDTPEDYERLRGEWFDGPKPRTGRVQGEPPGLPRREERRG
jgi:molybdenum cofactor cytidylyltransferase